jgi:hypothetical protein
MYRADTPLPLVKPFLPRRVTHHPEHRAKMKEKRKASDPY